ncbi:MULTISPECIES: ribosome biogenesis GTP-binding protein YihA/YsxC [Campylobacter]|uniref:ribosome biogenesis GTP-binding protein YihA/YsxC n=1 Tax=Campylobacter TaxID=194 RepID=UPI0023EFF1EE|nr:MULTISPECIES: ribosome biogenesis GTP-binding protein YihA/YsxC [Campylobacter]MCI6642327.1 ribosome biogenesis GTP-binding protein YihA/YsxC [Campylobacter sp.]MDD7422890.1 ribosome biogenesis GTP-binding protein YihA/YsxC [Campylobacter hominis]MDY3117008.1 ribosome biogenesis GTP-binding protein YihA/YsxC [Campylobacter hominis]
MIKICGAEFLISASEISQINDFAKSEIAFLGRSNVGKSSFINAIVNQKNLAKSSAIPGKTQLINFFEVNFKDEILSKNGENSVQNFSLIFVDLPGFGYAKVSKKMHFIWQKNLDEFIKNRTGIKLFVHLIDSRQFDLEIDENANSYIRSFLRPDQALIKFYTKSDKLNQKEKAAVLKYDPSAKFMSIKNEKQIFNAREMIVKTALGGESC